MILMCTRLYCWVSGIKSCDQKIEILVIIGVVHVLLFVHFLQKGLSKGSGLLQKQVSLCSVCHMSYYIVLCIV